MIWLSNMFEIILDSAVLVFLAIITAILLICGAVVLIMMLLINEPNEGTIIHMDYRPAHTTYVWSGKTMSPIFHSSCWEVMYINDDGDTGESCVDATEFQQLKLGNYYTP